MPEGSHRSFFKDVVLIVTAILVSFLLFRYGGCNDVLGVDKKTNVDSIYESEKWKSDSLNKEIEFRDSLLAVSTGRIDTVDKIINKYITKYKESIDTGEKIIACDSIIERCEELMVVCHQNDSIHYEQEYDLKLEVKILSKALDTTYISYKAVEHENEILKKKNKRLRIAAIGASAAAILLGIF